MLLDRGERKSASPLATSCSHHGGSHSELTVPKNRKRAADESIWSGLPSAPKVWARYFFPKAANCSGPRYCRLLTTRPAARTYGLWQQQCSILLSRKEREVQP